MARHPEMPYWYWQNMANAVGNRVTYVLGTISRSFMLGMHSNYRVVKADVLNALAE
jgi:hypothetical protein